MLFPLAPDAGGKRTQSNLPPLNSGSRSPASGLAGVHAHGADHFRLCIFYLLHLSASFPIKMLYPSCPFHQYPGTVTFTPVTDVFTVTGQL